MLIILIGISLVSALGWSCLPNRYRLISIACSTVTAVGLMWLLASSHMRNSDLLMISVIAFAISVLVNYFMNKLNKKK